MRNIYFRISYILFSCRIKNFNILLLPMNKRNIPKQEHSNKMHTCFYCGKSLSPNDIEYDHFFPISKFPEIKNNKNNLFISHRECNVKKSNKIPLLEKNYFDFVFSVLKNSEKFESIETEPAIGDIKYRPDIVAIPKNGNKGLVIEIKSLPILTEEKMHHIIGNLKKASDKFVPVLFFPGRINDKNKGLLEENGIKVWDINGFLLEFPNAAKSISNPYLKYLYSSAPKKDPYEDLKKELMNINKGKPDCVKYQYIVSKIFSELFKDELNVPKLESSDLSRDNRRDIVFANYSEHTKLKLLREHYGADYIVIECKNYKTVKVGKKEILQLSNYLKPYGLGMFGILSVRKSKQIKDAAKRAQMEMWAHEKKMIIFLDDSDIITMLDNKLNDVEPIDWIFQKIEDLRFSM